MTVVKDLNGLLLAALLSLFVPRCRRRRNLDSARRKQTSRDLQSRRFALRAEWQSDPARADHQTIHRRT